MVTLAEALAVAGTNRNAFNYWHRAGLLSTDFAPTTAGVARALTRENALELAFMTAATEVGLSPTEAHPHVTEWLQKLRVGSLHDFHARRGGSGSWVTFRDASVAAISVALGRRVSDPNGLLGPPMTVFSIINLGEIVRRVDALFAKENP